MLKLIKKFWKTGKKFIIAIVVIGIIGFLFLSRGNEKVEYVTEIAELKDIKQIVAVNGTVESDNKVELRFQQPGKVKTIDTEVGKRVKEGDLLASLDPDLATIDLSRADADIEMAKAELDLRYAGPGKEEITASEKRIKEAEVAVKSSETKLANTIKLNKESLDKARLDVTNATTAVTNYEKQYENSTASGEYTKESAEKSLEDAYANAKTTITSAMDAMQVSISIADSILGVDDTSINDYFEAELGAEDPVTKVAAVNKYKLTQTELEDFQEDYYELVKNGWKEDEVEAFLPKIKTSLEGNKNLIDKVYIVLTNTFISTKLTMTDLNTKKNNVLAQQSSIAQNINSIASIQLAISNAKLGIGSAGITNDTGLNTAKISLDNANNALQTAENALESVKIQNNNSLELGRMEIELNKVRLEQARANHAQLIAKPRSVDVAALKANLKRAESAKDQALKNMENTKIVAPGNGVITDIAVKIGENITNAEVAITMINDDLQITADIAETDITKIKIGNEVEITLDAFPIDQIFKGKVVEIDPAETVVQGVIYYQTKVLFDSEDSKIKSGMTANLDILTEKREGVIGISPEAIYYEENKPFVFVIVDKTKTENENVISCYDGKCKVRRDITIDLEGEDAIAVKSGVSEGEEVLLYEKE